MHPFIIYVIGLTVLYVFYYGITISADLTAGKKEEVTDEVIEAGDMAEELGSRNIIETADGSFSIEAYSPAHEQERLEGEENMYVEETQDISDTYAATNPPGHMEQIRENGQSAELPEGTDEQYEAVVENEEDLSENDDDTSKDDGDVQMADSDLFMGEDPEFEAFTFSPDDDINFSESASEDAPAFDTSLSHPDYGVLVEYGEKVSSVATKAEMVNDSLSSIDPKTNEYGSSEFRKFIHDQSKDIESQNVVQNF